MNAFGAEVATHLAIEYQRSGTPDSIGTIGNTYERVEARRVEVRTRYTDLVTAIRHELTTLS